MRLSKLSSVNLNQKLFDIYPVFKTCPIYSFSELTETFHQFMFS